MYYSKRARDFFLNRKTLIVVVSSSLISARSAHSEENWFTDSVENLCKNKSIHKSCDTPVTGGSVSTRFFYKKNNLEFADFFSSPCYQSTFSIEKKILSCENFVTLLQKKYRSCKKCLVQKTDFGI